MVHVVAWRHRGAAEHSCDGDTASQGQHGKLRDARGRWVFIHFCWAPHVWFDDRKRGRSRLGSMTSVSTWDREWRTTHFLLAPAVMMRATQRAASNGMLRVASRGGARFMSAQAALAKREEFSKAPIQAVVCDMAGTLVDHGSVAPVLAFVEVFKRVGVEVSVVRAMRCVDSRARPRRDT